MLFISLKGNNGIANSDNNIFLLEWNNIVSGKWVIHSEFSVATDYLSSNCILLYSLLHTVPLIILCNGWY